MTHEEPIFAISEPLPDVNILPDPVSEVTYKIPSDNERNASIKHSSDNEESDKTRNVNMKPSLGSTKLTHGKSTYSITGIEGCNINPVRKSDLGENLNMKSSDTDNSSDTDIVNQKPSSESN